MRRRADWGDLDPCRQLQVSCFPWDHLRQEEEIAKLMVKLNYYSTVSK
jgi:hypothetical protein